MAKHGSEQTASDETRIVRASRGSFVPWRFLALLLVALTLIGSRPLHVAHAAVSVIAFYATTSQEYDRWSIDSRRRPGQAGEAVDSPRTGRPRGIAIGQRPM